jgi:hypothetical protein
MESTTLVVGKKMLDGRISRAMLTLVLLCMLLSIVKADEPLITAPLDDLLPSRDDIPTQWYTGESSNETLAETGFVEGRRVGYYKLLGYDSVIVSDLYVYRFSDVANASTYCNKEIDKTKSEGGYSEVAIADVFAAIFDYGTFKIGVSWGAKSNIVFKVRIYDDYILEDPVGALLNFTNLMKIHIIPEFSSIAIIVLFASITIFVVTLKKRSYTNART